MMQRSLVCLTLASCLFAFAACGGGSAKNPNNSGGGPTANSVALTVGPGPSDMTNPAGGYANIPFASVTVCQPGSSNCTTIDHVLVDTGSAGLRLLAAELPGGFTLPSASTSNGSLFECLPFVDSFVWGDVVTADIQMADEKASAVPVQLITTAAAPNACSSAVATSNTQVSDVNALGAKGILGVGNFGADCGDFCTTVRSADFYFSCTSSAPSSCTQVGTPLAQQVTNPVLLFASDNNGVVIQLSSVPAGGASSATGTMFFGIGTQSNNTPPSGLAVLSLDGFGDFSTTFQSASMPNSFADTGSNALFFGTYNSQTQQSSTGITVCNLGTSSNPAFFYCPSSELNESATVAGSGNAPATTTVNFSVGNPNNLTGYAASDLAATNSDGTSFDWGLPFFFGRTVYIGFEGQSSSLGSGLYLAF